MGRPVRRLWTGFCIALTVSGWSVSATAAPGRSKAPLPESCSAAPRLTPVGPTPSWPAGPAILDAVRGALASQYPSVYGGIFVPHTPRKSLNTHFTIVETVHDPTLEVEVRAAYPPFITVSFKLGSRSSECLTALKPEVAAAALKAGIKPVFVGLDTSKNSVILGVAACSTPATRAVKKWAYQQWGHAVRVTPCQKQPVFKPAGFGR